MSEVTVHEPGYTLVHIFNEDTPGASTKILANVDDIDGNTHDSLTGVRRPTTVFYVEMTHETAGVITVSVTRGTTEITSKMFGGNQVAAGTMANFKVRVESGDVIDLYHSAASGKILRLVIREAGME